MKSARWNERNEQPLAGDNRQRIAIELINLRRRVDHHRRTDTFDQNTWMMHDYPYSVGEIFGMATATNRPTFDQAVYCINRIFA